MSFDIRLEVEKYQKTFGFHVVRVRGTTGDPKDAKKAVKSGALANQKPKPNDFLPGEGVALVLGDDIADLDLDHPMACRIAQRLVPMHLRTFVFERAGKPFSHIVLRVPGIDKRYVFNDIKKEGEDNKPLLELRGKRTLYTVLPPSPHPSGEEMRFVAEGALVEVSEDDAVLLARAIAIGALVVLHYPTSDRHFAISHLTGLLLRGGMSENGVRKTINAIVREAEVEGLENQVDDRLAFMETTIATYKAGQPVTGGPKLKDLLGADVVDRLYSWLKCVDDDTVVLDYKSPMGAAEEYVKRCRTSDDFLASRHQADTFYDYDQGVYVEVEDASVRADVYAFLRDAKVWQDTDDEPILVPYEPNLANVANIMDAYRALTHLPSRQQAPVFLTEVTGMSMSCPHELLVCRNGIVRFDTRELLNHTPRFYTHTGLDCDYAHDAPSPSNWLAFLHQLWPNDQESIDSLQELFGYLLTVDNRFQKIFLLIGPKRSGKGTIARMLRLLVGARNMCNPTLSSLGGQFGKQVLIDKSLAIISDARLSGRTDPAVVAETLLSISGGDSQSISRKNKTDWNGDVFVRFMVLTNELPKLRDMSGALASRFVIWKMTESFFGKEDLTLFEKKLAPEVGSVLNWALDGRDRLYRRGHFVQPKSAVEELRQLLFGSSPVKQFIDERCLVGPGLEVDTELLFEAWKQWCLAQNIQHAGTASTFGSDLSAALPSSRRASRRQGARRFRVYEGVMLTPEAAVQARIPDLDEAGRA